MGDLDCIQENDFFMAEVLKCSHRLPREEVGNLSLKTLKVRLDRALSTMIEL